MAAPILKQLPSGRMVDLLRPDPAMLDSEFWGVDVPVALTRIARFGGAAGCPLTLRPWSVLDHSVVGADLLQPLGKRLQLLFLLHDVHEAVIGDIPTPTARAVAAHVGTLCRLADTTGLANGESATRSAIARIKSAWDHAIFASAGVPLPQPEEASAIHLHDVRMMVTEKRDLMQGGQRHWPGLEAIKPLAASLKDKQGRLPSPQARVEAFLTRLDSWAPQARRRSIDPFADYAEAAQRLGYQTEAAR